MSAINQGNDNRRSDRNSAWVARLDELNDKPIISALVEHETADWKSKGFSIERFALILIALQKTEEYEPCPWTGKDDFLDEYYYKLKEYKKHCKIRICADIALECFEQIRAVSCNVPACERDWAAIVGYRLSEALTKGAGSKSLKSGVSGEISSLALRLAEVVGLPRVQSVSELIEKLNAPNQLSPLAACGVWLSLHYFQKALINESSCCDKIESQLMHDTSAVFALKAAFAARDLVRTPTENVVMLQGDRLEKLEQRISRRVWAESLADIVLPSRSAPLGEPNPLASFLLMETVDLVVRASKGSHSMHRALRALDCVAPFVAELTPENFSSWMRRTKDVATLAEKLGEHDASLELWQQLDRALSERVTTITWNALAFHNQLSWEPKCSADIERWLGSLPHPWRIQDSQALISRQENIRSLISQALDSVDQKQQDELLSDAQTEWKTLARECWRDAGHARYILVESLLDLVEGHMQFLPDDRHKESALRLWGKFPRILEKFDREPLVEYMSCWCRWTALGLRIDSDDVLAQITKAHADSNFKIHTFFDNRAVHSETIAQQLPEALSLNALDVMYRIVIATSHIDENQTLQRIEEYLQRYQSADLATRFSDYHWFDLQELSVSLFLNKAASAEHPEQAEYIDQAQKVVAVLREAADRHFTPFVRSALKVCPILVSESFEDDIPEAARQLWLESSQLLSTYFEKVGKREEIDEEIDSDLSQILELVYTWGEQVVKADKHGYLEQVEKLYSAIEKQLSSYLVFYDTALGHTDVLQVEDSDLSFALVEFEDGTTSFKLNRYRVCHLDQLRKLAEIRIQRGEEFYYDAGQATESFLSNYLKYFGDDSDLDVRISVYEQAADLYERCGHFLKAEACRQTLEGLYRQEREQGGEEGV